MAPVNKTAVIAAAIETADQIPMIFSTGYMCRIARSIADRPNHFLMVGSMGLAAPIGTGVALVSGCPVVVVDGDGALAMNPGALLTAGAFEGLRLAHVVIDDGLYASTGGQPVPMQRADFVALAQAAGYRQAVRTTDVRGFTDALCEAVMSPGSTLVHCIVDVDTGASELPPRIDSDLHRLAARFADTFKDSSDDS